MVKPIESPDIQNWIVIIDQLKDLPQRGEIVSIGNEVESLKIGEIVWFHKYEGGVPIREGDELYLVIDEEKILGREEDGSLESA